MRKILAEGLIVLAFAAADVANAQRAYDSAGCCVGLNVFSPVRGIIERVGTNYKIW